MNPFRMRLIVLYVFLVAVVGISIQNIWLLQTNPFVSYLGGGRWFYLLRDLGVIAVAALTIRALILREKRGPRFVLLIACFVLVVYLGSGVILVALLNTVPFYRVVDVGDIIISALAMASMIALRMKGFTSGYARGL